MKTSIITPKEDQHRFLRIVEKYIEEFLPEQSEERSCRLKSLREAIKEKWSIEDGELFFHSEPIHLVSDLAGDSFDLEKYGNRYNEIRDEEGYV